MKKWPVLFLSVILCLWVVGCSSQEASNQPEPKEEAKAEQAEETAGKKELKPDEPMTEPGQFKKVPDVGRMELLQIVKPDKEIDLSPVKLTVKGIRIGKITEIAPDFKELIKNLGWKPADAAYAIQVDYAVENTEEKNIFLGPGTFSHLVLSNGDQVDGSQKLITGKFDTEFMGKVKKNDEWIMYLLEEEPKDIESVKLVTGTVYDNDSMKEYQKSKSVTIPMK